MTVYLHDAIARPHARFVSGASFEDFAHHRGDIGHDPGILVLLEPEGYLQRFTSRNRDPVFALFERAEEPAPVFEGFPVEGYKGIPGLYPRLESGAVWYHLSHNVSRESCNPEETVSEEIDDKAKN